MKHILYKDSRENGKKWQIVEYDDEKNTITEKYITARLDLSQL